MHSPSPHCRQLQPEDRMTLASLQQQNYSIRAVARVLHQSPSIVSRELIACLRQAHNKRAPRSKGQDRRGQIPCMLSIHVRPPDIEDRQFSGHWEGDLIKGKANASAVGTLVERTSRLLMLIKLPYPKPERWRCTKS